MNLSQAILLLTWMQLYSAHSQCWNGYNLRNSLDGYNQLYNNYPYGCYECNSYAANVYSTPVVEYVPPCNSVSESSKPMVIVINGGVIEDYESELLNMLALISNLKEQPDELLYMPYENECAACNKCRCKPEVVCSNGCCKNACGCSQCAVPKKCECPYIEVGPCGACDCVLPCPKPECECNACRNPIPECEICNKCCNGVPKVCIC